MAFRSVWCLALSGLVLEGVVSRTMANESNSTVQYWDLASENLTIPGRFAWNDSLMIDPNGFIGKAPLLNSGVWTWITTVFGMPIFSVFAYRAAPRNCAPCCE